jgi:hypothetical protein
MPQSFAAERKEKRWIVWLKDYTGVAYHRSGSVGNYIYTEIEGDLWSKHQETESFEIAKAAAVEHSLTLGLENIMITRVTDVYSVLYPIA